MGAKRWETAIGFCVVIALARAAPAQSVVYDNSTTYTGVEHAAGLTPGIEITLAGSSISRTPHRIR